MLSYEDWFLLTSRRPSRKDKGRLGLITERIAPPNATGCWLWLGCKNQAGYGKISGNYVHRWMWQQVYGEIPSGFHVLHKCDIPSCVNPKHLWLGTHQDNIRDRDLKGRGIGGYTYKLRRRKSG